MGSKKYYFSNLNFLEQQLSYIYLTKYQHFYDKET